MLNETMDYTKPGNILADSAGRAFGGISSKFQSFKSIDYSIFTRLFDTCIVPIMDYASGVWGFKDYPHANAIQHRIIRSFLGLHRFAPSLAVNGDMGWLPAVVRRRIEMVRLWCRLVRMNEDRITKRIFLYDLDLCRMGVKNWCHELKHIFTITDQMHLFNTVTAHFSLPHVLEMTKERLMNEYKMKWQNDLVRFPKLRTYKQLKSDYGTEAFVRKMLTSSERSFLSQTRCGILPIRIETGRYTSPKTPEHERICPVCDSEEVENEIHFVTKCELYTSLRNTLYTKACEYVAEFNNLSNEDKFVLLMTHEKILKDCAKFIHNAYRIRTNQLFVSVN